MNKSRAKWKRRKSAKRTPNSSDKINFRKFKWWNWFMCECVCVCERWKSISLPRWCWFCHLDLVQMIRAFEMIRALPSHIMCIFHELISTDWNWVCLCLHCSSLHVINWEIVNNTTLRVIVEYVVNDYTRSAKSENNETDLCIRQCVALANTKSYHPPHTAKS